MKQVASILILQLINYAIASCPICDIKINTIIKLNPDSLNKENQNVRLELNLKCPRDTWFHSFAGYTIHWGDETETLFGYDFTKKRYDDCKKRGGVACSPNVYESNYLSNLSSMTTLTQNHTYQQKQDYNIHIDLTTIQKKTDPLVSCGTYSNVALSVKSIDTAIKKEQNSQTSLTPIDYCAIPNSYALFAREDIRMNDGVKCSTKNISSKLCKVGALEYFNLGVNGMADEVHINGNVDLRNNSIIYSGIWAKNINAQNGAQFTKKGLSTIFNVNMNIQSINYGSTTEFIEKNKSKSYEPGFYGDVTIRQGGMLILNSNGKYYFRSLKFENGSILKLNGSSIKEIYTQSFNFAGSLQGATASKFLVGITGTSDSFIDKSFTGSIWAPNSKLVLGQYSNVVYNGSYMAKRIIIHQYSKINYVQFVNNEACK